MAWIPPTLADFRTRFPVFAAVPDETAEAVLAEAIANVGGTFIERDRTPAILYLTAHLLAADGWLSGAGAGGGGAAVTGPIRSRTVGDVSVTFAGVSSKAGDGSIVGQYLSTVYGQRYLALLRLNSPAILVV